jgi:hypothetical protein
MIKPDIEKSPAVKIMFNIGSLLDIPTGYWLEGRNKENILLGGLGILTGVTAKANDFKSTLLHYMMLSAVDRIFSTTKTILNTFDTEVNVHEHRLKKLCLNFKYLKNEDLIDNEIWTVTDKTIYFGNQWFEVLKKYLRSKVESKKTLESETPFFNRDKTTIFKIITPTFTEIDSFSDFETEDVAEMQDNNELGESGGNTIHMRQGLAKLRLLMSLPTLAGTSMNFFLMTAQLGKETTMASGPFAPQPSKKLRHMGVGDKIKGITDKFTFLMSNCWYIVSANPLVNPGTKAAEYPTDKLDDSDNSLDLNLITIRQLRSKSGLSGITLEIIAAQSEGVLPTLTEFHYIKGCDRFGISGSLQHYNLDLYPTVNLSRPTIRSKIDSDAKLRRAINITSELCQMYQYHRHLNDILCSPKQLMEDLISLGYDWDMLLDTRGWWTLDNYSNKIPNYLSTKDLLDMRVGKYFPYWLEEDKKTIKKEFIVKEVV